MWARPRSSAVGDLSLTMSFLYISSRRWRFWAPILRQASYPIASVSLTASFSRLARPRQRLIACIARFRKQKSSSSDRLRCAPASLSPAEGRAPRLSAAKAQPLFFELRVPRWLIARLKYTAAFEYAAAFESAPRTRQDYGPAQTIHVLAASREQAAAAASATKTPAAAGVRARPAPAREQRQN